MPSFAASDPTNASVAPFGGVDRILGPDPIAIGIPTDGDPILIDTSSSITTNGMTARVAAAVSRANGSRMPTAGLPTIRPSCALIRLAACCSPAATITAKGYGKALMVEALTHGLSGYGRRQHETRWTESVTVQVFDPEFFAGLPAFTAETGYLADLCRASRPAPGQAAVRMPGDAALARRRTALQEGVALPPGLVAALVAAVGKPLPDALV